MKDNWRPSFSLEDELFSPVKIQVDDCGKVLYDSFRSSQLAAAWLSKKDCKKASKIRWRSGGCCERAKTRTFSLLVGAVYYVLYEIFGWLILTHSSSGEMCTLNDRLPVQYA